MLFGESVDLPAGAKDFERVRGCASCKSGEELVEELLILFEGQLSSRVLELFPLPSCFEERAPDDGSERGGGERVRDELAGEEGREGVVGVGIEEAEDVLDALGES